MISVVIATNNRPKELRGCLESLRKQTRLPDEVIIAHGGGDPETERISREFDVEYYNFGPLGSARQRNKGAEKSLGDIILFLDDDIRCEADFIKEIAGVFAGDTEKKIGGVSGIIVNQAYAPLGGINKKLFDLCLRKEERDSDYAGKLVGPAINFLPWDRPGIEQPVSWLSSCSSAYRRDAFMKHGFNKSFEGYSFTEDVELSSIVGKNSKLVNTTRARCFHKDLGGKTHENWVEIGKMQILNRWHVMVNVLGKNTPSDKIRFFYYQLYCLITETKFLSRRENAVNTLLRWWGRFLGCLSLLRKNG